MSDLKEAIREAKEEAYMKCQKACGLEVGDRVKVLRIAEDHEDGWTNSWVNEMNPMVGKIHTITSINEYGGISLSGGLGNFGFPFFVLKKILPARPEFLSADKTWTGSLNLQEDIDDYQILGQDSEYVYSLHGDMLYRTKIE